MLFLFYMYRSDHKNSQTGLGREGRGRLEEQSDLGLHSLLFCLHLLEALLYGKTTHSSFRKIIVRIQTDRSGQRGETQIRGAV